MGNYISSSVVGRVLAVSSSPNPPQVVASLRVNYPTSVRLIDRLSMVSAEIRQIGFSAWWVKLFTAGSWSSAPLMLPTDVGAVHALYEGAGTPYPWWYYPEQPKVAFPAQLDTEQYKFLMVKPSCTRWFIVASLALAATRYRTAPIWAYYYMSYKQVFDQTVGVLTPESPVTALSWFLTFVGQLGLVASYHTELLMWWRVAASAVQWAPHWHLTGELRAGWREWAKRLVPLLVVQLVYRHWTPLRRANMFGQGTHPKFGGWDVALRGMAMHYIYAGMVGLASALPLYSRGARSFDIVAGRRLQDGWRTMPVMPVTDFSGSHSHPGLARARAEADRTLNAYARRFGMEPYALQLCSRDARAGVTGSLIPYWAADRALLEGPPISAPLKDYHIIKGINVDYYLDYTEYLYLARPFMLYTFTPQVPAGRHLESHWSTGEDNKVHMYVAGGAEYHHELWDYGIDRFTVEYPGVSIDYCVETHPVDDHWSLVLLMPTKAYRNVQVETRLIGLKRRQMVRKIKTIDQQERMACVFERNVDGAFVIAAPGSYESLVMQPDMVQVVRSRALLGKMDMPNLITLLGSNCGPDPRKAAAIILAAFPVEGGGYPRVDPPRPFSAYSYGRLGFTDLVPRERDTAKILSPPVLPGAYVPLRSRGNDWWYLKERLLDVNQGIEQFPPKFTQYFQDFIRRVFPVPGMLNPWEIDQVIEHQDRPAQKRVNLEAKLRLDGWLAGGMVDLRRGNVEVKVFQKAETYPTPDKPPRGISTVPDEFKLLWSCYTLALAEHFKTLPFYAFGMHPNKLAYRVSQLAGLSTHVMETDFSKFDGSIGRAWRDELELPLFLRAFPPAHHPLIIDMYNRVIACTGRTMTGIRYELKASRASGSPDTSIGNTSINSAFGYVCHREEGMPDDVAYARLGVMGGDDGYQPVYVDVDTKKRVVEDVCKRTGLVAKVVVKRSTEPCEMLARIYPSPVATPFNLANLPRQLCKLHLSATSQPLDRWVFLYNKARGYQVMDPSTPILADWCEMIMRLCPPEFRTANDDLLPWTAREWIRHQREVAEGKTEPAPVIAPLSRDALLEEAARQLGIDVTRIVSYINELRELKSIDELKPLVDVSQEVAPHQIPPPGVRLGDNVAPLAVDPSRNPLPGMLPHPVVTGRPGMATDRHAAGEIARILREYVPAETATVVWDCFAMEGAFTLIIAGVYPKAKIIAVEISKEIAVKLRANLAAFNLMEPRVIVRTMPVADALNLAGNGPSAATRPTLLVLDPPWAGAEASGDVKQLAMEPPLPQFLARVWGPGDTAEGWCHGSVRAAVIKLPPSLDRKTSADEALAPQIRAQLSLMQQLPDVVRRNTRLFVLPVMHEARIRMFVAVLLRTAAPPAKPTVGLEQARVHVPDRPASELKEHKVEREGKRAARPPARRGFEWADAPVIPAPVVVDPANKYSVTESQLKSLDWIPHWTCSMFVCPLCHAWSPAVTDEDLWCIYCCKKSEFKSDGPVDALTNIETVRRFMRANLIPGESKRTAPTAAAAAPPAAAPAKVARPAQPKRPSKSRESSAIARAVHQATRGRLRGRGRGRGRGASSKSRQPSS